MQFDNKRVVLLLGCTYFILSIGLSVQFAAERIAFGDAAYQLFTILRTKDFAIQVMRFGACCSQLFPLVGSWLHLDLKSIIFLYSISFEVVPFAIFLMLILYFDNIRLAIVLLLFKTLITTHTFFWVQSELLQGVPFLILFIAWLEHKIVSRFSTKQFVIFFVFHLTLVFFHPLLLFPFLFCLSYILFFNTEGYFKKTVSTSLLLFIVISVIKTLLIKNTYDRSATSGLKNFLIHFPYYLNTPSNKDFIRFCVSEYYLLPLLTLILFIGLAIQRKWKLFAYTLLFIGCYFLMIQITNYNSELFHFRIESFYLPIVAMLSMVLVYEFNTHCHFKTLILPVNIVAICCFFYRIEKKATPYAAQVEWNRKFITQHSNEKLVVDGKHLPSDTIMLPWTFTYQTWLISTVENGKTVSCLSTNDPHAFDWALSKKEEFITPWGNFEHKKMNQKYFIFADDSIGYKQYVP
jgi:hypothetical protein